MCKQDEQSNALNHHSNNGNTASLSHYRYDFSGNDSVSVRGRKVSWSLDTITFLSIPPTICTEYPISPHV